MTLADAPTVGSSCSAISCLKQGSASSLLRFIPYLHGHFCITPEIDPFVLHCVCVCGPLVFIIIHVILKVFYEIPAMFVTDLAIRVWLESPNSGLYRNFDLTCVYGRSGSSVHKPVS